ncbi:uncharacterized protein LOC101854636 [Aplysia californica]|uniref:Uncharacterized protein LOC101854636 n=1 Tax=Aplysia californica TaxID=6500 RepID=A0ABM0JNF5_APLCA|nr:uncharacterized protein LOC101854636 [Aplysia californica]
MWKLNQLFVIAICLVYTEAGFTFDATPGQIQTCTGGHLSLKCTLNDPQNGTGLVQLISLSIYKTENGARKEDLASIDAFSNGKVHTKPSLTATAVGNISSTASSYLLLDYPAPQAGVTGDFECEAHGTNFFGHPVVLTSATSVNDVTPPGSPGVSPTEDLSVLTEFQFLKDKEQNKVRGYFGQYKFINSSVFMGHTYLVSAKHLPYDVAWSQCAKYGGYLVEINSKVEHEFISNFMDSVDN